MPLADVPARHPLPLLAVAVLVTLASVASALTIEAQVDFVDTVPPHPGLEAYRALLDRLDGVRFTVVYMAHDPAGGAESLRAEAGFDALVREQAALRAFLEARFPEGTFSHALSAHEAMRAGHYMLMRIATAGNPPEDAYSVPEDPRTYAAVRDRVLAEESLDQVVAKDGASALVLLFFATTDNGEARRLAGEVDEAVSEWRATPARHPATTDHATSGLLQASHYADEMNRRETERLAPYASAGAAVALLVVLRRPVNALIAVASLAAALAWTYGAMGFLGLRISFLTVFLAPVVVGVGVDYAVHVLHRFEAERDGGAPRREAVARAVRHAGGAVGLAALTTAAGLSTLLLVPAPLFAEIGGVGAMGILLGFVAAVTVAPALRALLPERRRRRAGRHLVGGLLARLAVALARRPAVAVAVVLLVGVGSAATAWSGTRVQAGEASNEFPADDPVILLQQRIEAEYGAFQRVYLVVRGDLEEPAALRALHCASLAMEGVPRLRGASSVADLLLADDRTDEGSLDLARDGLLGAAGRAPEDEARLPGTKAEARERLDRLFADPLWRSVAPFTLSRDRALAVVAVTIDPWRDEAELHAIRDAMRARADDLRRELGPRFDVAAAGSPMNRAAILEQTPADVLVATAGAAGVVFAVLALAWSRRGAEGLRVAAAAGGLVLLASLVLVASIPVVDAAYGWMHEVFGAPRATVALSDMLLLAFALTVAVGVDDLVLLAHRHWEARDAGAAPMDALRESFTRCGLAVTGTTATTVAAFGAMAGVYFLQSKNLAVLAALGVLVAYLLTLLLAPLALVGPRRR